MVFFLHGGTRLYETTTELREVMSEHFSVIAWIKHAPLKVVLTSLGY